MNDTSKKSVADRLRHSTPPEKNNILTLRELCEALSVSAATGRNWIRLGKITPIYTRHNTPCFTKEYVYDLQARLRSGEIKALKSRRNKKFVSGNCLYNSYVSQQCRNIPVLQKLLSLIAESEISLDIPTIQLLAADCALHLFAASYHQPVSTDRNLLAEFLSGAFSIGEYDVLIKDLAGNVQTAAAFCRKHPMLFHMEYVYEPDEDILGLIYLSCKNIANRKATGSYYTPTSVVKDLIAMLDLQPGKKVLDPCCGTGNFLIQLPSHIPFEDVFGNDIDASCVRIARLNMALKYKVSCASIISHITNQNYLTENTRTGFHYIIGNPPWGVEFTEAEKTKLQTVFHSASGKKIESYDVFIEQALNQLTENGRLAFILPEAILNVNSHTGVREYMLKHCSIRNLCFLGNVFDKVHCPCIVLDLQRTHSPLKTTGMNVRNGENSFTINTDRPVDARYFSFTATDEEYRVLQKIRNIRNASSLRNNADFALGIVTGNNKEYISDNRTAEQEVVLRGSDLCRYHIRPAGHYIRFQPENYQQSAPVRIYRAREKLLYRFICSQLVFAYDDQQTLSLNSCNIVIPRIPGINMKYVLAILNSRVAQFIYQLEFRSVKVLRSHIESIPVPLAGKTTQEQIIAVTNRLISGLKLKEAETVYNELDALICDLFQLNDIEIEIIKNAVDGANKYLI